MREHLFRGIRVDNGEWVEGFYHYSNWINPITKELVRTTYCILPIGGQDAYNVIPETVSEYIGIDDNNGNKIWENSVVKFDDIIGVVNYNMGCFCIKTNKPDWMSRNNPAIDIILNEYPNEIEVIGNVFENSELLEG